MASSRGSAKVAKNLNQDNLHFRENQIVSESEAMREILYSLPSVILNERTLKTYKTKYKQGKLSPNIIQEILISSGFKKEETKWKFTNKIIK